jgi:hypothetical protein
MKLKDAIERYRGEPGAVANAYGWYRKDAQRFGKVSLGGSWVPVRKEGGTWIIEPVELDDAMTAHRKGVSTSVNRQRIPIERE